MDWTLFLGLFLQTLICSVIGQDSSQMPPNLTSTFNDEYFFPRDSTLNDASFNCTTENGRVQYVWKKDGVVVQNNQLLKFVKMQNEDYGTYQCFATNDYGTSLSKPFKIMEARLGYFPTTQTQEVQCEEFKHCEVECRDKPTCLPESQCRVEWKIGEGTKTNVEINERVGVDGNGDLHFLWTNMSDWSGQQYGCGVWHDQLKRLVVGSQTRLSINSATAVPKVNPMVVVKENGKARIGEKGVLRCIFSGYPVPDITWISPQKMYIDNTSDKYEVSDFGRVLTILRAESEYEGIYTCKHSGKNESVYLNVTSAPFLRGSNQMQDLMVLEGKEATFRCDAESLPKELPPTPPAWKKNGVDLKADGGKYLLRENSKLLTVTNVQKSDNGAYQCMSENSEGVLLEEAILKVIERITIQDRPQSSYKIVPGDVLNLAVIADTDPFFTLQYKWMFTDHQGNKREIENSEYWKISLPNNNNLTIDVRQVKERSILLSLAGYYSVKIYHKYDQEVINITVETDVITMETDFIPADVFTTNIVNTFISANIITTKVVPKPHNFEETSSNAAVPIVVTVIVFIIVIVIGIIVARRIQQKGSSMDKTELATGHDSENERKEKENSLQDQPVSSHV